MLNHMFTESYNTISFTNCLLSRNHDIGCDCSECKLCRDDIIKFYKNKEKTKIKKRSLISKSFDDNNIKSIPIKNFKKENNYITSSSLPNMYGKKSYLPIAKETLDDKCIICNKNYNNKLINNFYYLCEICYINHEL
jgi:hypothetical protein